MTTSLENLFEQIIHSERRAQERRNLLNEIRIQVNSLQSQTSEHEDESKSLRGQVVLKVQHLNEEEMKVKWLTCKHLILEDQRNELIKEREELVHQLKSIKDHKEKEGCCFCDEVRRFSEGYSLTGNGRSRREDQVRHSLLEKQQEEKDYRKGLQSFTMHRSLIDIQMNQKDVFLEELESMKIKENELENELQCATKKLQEMEKEKDVQSAIPQNEAEFQRLQHELEDARSDRLEKKCCELQKELHNIQQRLWQKQVKVQGNQWMPSRPQFASSENKTEKLSNRLHLANFKATAMCADSEEGPRYDQQVLENWHALQTE